MTLIALALALARSNPCPGLPLAAGTSWTYRAEVVRTASGDSASRRSLSWTTTVLAVRATDSAVAATIRQWPGDLAWWRPGDTAAVSVLYCAGGRVYLVRCLHAPAAAVAEALLSGAQRPDVDDLILDLPLYTGKLFGHDPAERKDAFYAWFVESAEPVPPAFGGYDLA